MNEERTLVVMPTYNEAENIELVLKRLRDSVPAADILVVDDGSPDGTGDLADAAASTDTQVHVLHRTTKEGLGPAYLAGFAWGLDRGYDVLVEIDADGSHQPEQLPQLLQALSAADLVIGSRWVRGGAVVNWPLRREALSRAGSVYTRLVLGTRVRDATSGFRAYRASALREVDLSTVQSQGYCFQLDLVRRAAECGLRVTEVPITFSQRMYGASKMSGGIIAEAMANVARWGYQRRRDQVRRWWAGRRGR